jgi:hypothetical protein
MAVVIDECSQCDVLLYECKLLPVAGSITGNSLPAMPRCVGAAERGDGSEHASVR